MILLLSSELSPDGWADRNGESRDPGETARLISLPVLIRGFETIFNYKPDDVKKEDFDSWVREQFRILRDGLPQQRGTAFKRYIEFLVRRPEAVTKCANARVAQFERVVAKPNMSAIERDVVAKFGLLYAGGWLAIKSGVLPFEGKLLGQDVIKACRLALAELPDPDKDLREDMALLKERLGGGSIIDIDSSSRKQQRMMRNADGYHQAEKTGRQYTIRAQVFEGWFSSLLRNKRVLTWLDQEGFLQHKRERSQGRSNEWAHSGYLAGWHAPALFHHLLACRSGGSRTA